MPIKVTTRLDDINFTETSTPSWKPFNRPRPNGRCRMHGGPRRQNASFGEGQACDPGPRAYERKNQNKRDTNFLNVLRGGEVGVAWRS